MTCPDWNRLTAHRLADPATAAARVPEAWGAALDHLDGCPECRRRALAADPTLLFRSLPDWETDAAGEVDAMRSGVAALRRAHRVTPRSESEPAAAGAAPGASARSTGERNAWRAAAAAVLAAALLSAAPAVRQTAGDAPRAGALPGAIGAAQAVPVAYLDDPTLSTVDDIEHPTASVYHFDDEEVAVVMVVDAGLDV